MTAVFLLAATFGLVTTFADPPSIEPLDIVLAVDVAGFTFVASFVPVHKPWDTQLGCLKADVLPVEPPPKLGGEVDDGEDNISDDI